jgi:hypothetical protein
MHSLTLGLDTPLAAVTDQVTIAKAPATTIKTSAAEPYHLLVVTIATLGTHPGKRPYGDRIELLWHQWGDVHNLRVANTALAIESDLARRGVPGKPSGEFEQRFLDLCMPSWSV